MEFGCNAKTLYKVRNELGIKCQTKGYGEEKSTVWLISNIENDSIDTET